MYNEKKIPRKICTNLQEEKYRLRKSYVCYKYFFHASGVQSLIDIHLSTVYLKAFSTKTSLKDEICTLLDHGDVRKENEMKQLKKGLMSKLYWENILFCRLINRSEMIQQINAPIAVDAFGEFPDETVVTNRNSLLIFWQCSHVERRLLPFITHQTQTS